MPPRLRLCSSCLRWFPPSNVQLFSPVHFKLLSTAAVAEATTPFSGPPLIKYPPTQPPSHRPPEFRKSQVHRQYTSLLRSTPLMLLFQHNNLVSTEWMSVRRELSQALRNLDTSLPDQDPLVERIKIQIIQTKIFQAALLVTEYFHPEKLSPPPEGEQIFTHALSRYAHDAVARKKKKHPLSPLLCGPLAIVTFPTVSPVHLKTVLSILAPTPPKFPAPPRRTSPGYYDPSCQSGLQKLLLLGARVEGKVFDHEKTRWVGGIDGGMEGLLGQLVGMLQGFGAGVTQVLEGQGRSLYFTLEGLRGILEDEERGGKVKGKKTEE